MLRPSLSSWCDYLTVCDEWILYVLVMNGAFRFQFEWLFFRLDIQKYYLYISEKFI